MLPLSRVLESCLYVDDLDVAERFYADVLGLQLLSKQPGRHLFFRCGKQMVLLFNATESAKPNDVPSHGACGPGHLAFAVAAEELPAWQEQLARHQVPIEKIYDWPRGGRSIYFRDPAGNSLEFATPSIWGLAD